MNLSRLPQFTSDQESAPGGLPLTDEAKAEWSKDVVAGRRKAAAEEELIESSAAHEGLGATAISEPKPESK